MAHRFRMKKVAARAARSRTASAPLPMLISMAGFVGNGIILGGAELVILIFSTDALIPDDRAQTDTISLSRPSSNFIWNIEKLESL